MRILVAGRTVLRIQVFEDEFALFTLRRLDVTLFRARMALAALHVLVLAFDQKARQRMVELLLLGEGRLQVAFFARFVGKLLMELPVVLVLVARLTEAGLLVGELELRRRLRRRGRQHVLGLRVTLGARILELQVCAHDLEVRLRVVERLTTREVRRRMALEANLARKLGRELPLVHVRVAVLAEALLDARELELPSRTRRVAFEHFFGRLVTLVTLRFDAQVCARQLEARLVVIEVEQVLPRLRRVALLAVIGREALRKLVLVDVLVALDAEALPCMTEDELVRRARRLDRQHPLRRLVTLDALVGDLRVLTSQDEARRVVIEDLVLERRRVVTVGASLTDELFVELALVHRFVAVLAELLVGAWELEDLLAAFQVTAVTLQGRVIAG